MILMRANPLLGPLAVVGPEKKSVLFCAKMTLASIVVISWPKKVLIFRANPFRWMLPASKSLRPTPYKQQVQ